MTATPQPGITHYLNRQGSPKTTVHYITKDGDAEQVTGRVEGWGATPSGVQKLIVAVHEGNQGPARYRKVYVPAAAIERQLRATGQHPAQRQPVIRWDYCGDCGKVLGSGRIGHLDGSVVPGLCFNCA